MQGDFAPNLKLTFIPANPVAPRRFSDSRTGLYTPDQEPDKQESDQFMDDGRQ